uniref:Structural maintenance of chromosomes 1B n=1 Tax=Neogobius melanostomus TaxID=47308 RepID=A0A8C6T3Z6_9GOBI
MGYLKQIDVDNFKSWRGKQTIGPFLRFSCIIGTNGSGKSNVMDAISFAIGERSSTLRVKHLRDLIHGAHIGAPVSRSASVCLRYCSEEEEETSFSRTINGDSSEYRVNGVQMTLSQYLKQLEEIGVITKAQNCLVFQDEGGKGEEVRDISQSRELASEYEQKKNAMLRSKEDTQFHFNKKKSAVVERKQVSQEKLEAEKYQSLLDELNESRLQLSLTRLFHMERSINSASDELKRKQQAAAAKQTLVSECEQRVKAHKKEHGKQQRELQQTDKDIRAQEQVLSQCRGQYIKAKVNSSHHQKKAEEALKAVTRAEQRLAVKEQELEHGRRDMEELQEAWRRQEAEALRQRTSRDIQLDQGQLERYQELKEVSRRQSAVLNQQAEKLQWEISADQERLALDQRRRKEAQVRNYQNQLEDVTRRAEKLEEYTAICKSSIEDLSERERALSAELQTGRDRAEEVQQELGAVLEELGNAGLETHENKRQTQRKEVLERLQQLCPDTVFGRLSDLVSPIHKKYHLAVTKVFSRFLNAIVVSSERVARDCIKYIKDERCEPETFLPIDYLDVLPLNERLRELPGAKMAVDVVQASSPAIAAQLRRVVQFVCGNTLVCDTIKEARAMAFDKHERRKTVALDGTMFARSGVISGGSSDLRSKARCWDDKEVKSLKERKQRLMKELAELMKLRRKESDLKQIQAECHGAQTRLKYSSVDLELLRKRALPKIQADISRLESDLSNLESEIQMQELVKLQRDVMIWESELEQQRLFRHNLLLSCKIQGLPITLLSGDLQSIAEVQLEADSESTLSTVEIYEREAQLVIDFSPLTFDASSRASRKCSQEFEAVKSRRCQLFTQNSSAQAILSAENPEEPYLGGIIYNCVAPGKRFMSMDNLSEERRLWPRSFRPAPFLILDEVDAALDNSNIGKVTGFIREQSQRQMQIIVISLKEEFFSKADALLGVYSDLDEWMFSRILTLDLRPYPLTDDDQETDLRGNSPSKCANSCDTRSVIFQTLFY